ncbi:MAG: flavin reductase family protein [Firmicutes bacterium]|nr:flavin reductase family protein [Bacillota bacterium]
MAFDSLAFRKALGQFATGVTVASVKTDAGVHGMTANSFTSVSLEPPLVLVCVDKTRQTHGLLLAEGRFGISVLAREHEAVSNWFAGRRGQAAHFVWRNDVTVSPVLDGALAWFDCTLEHAYEGGDHTIFVGRVDRFGTGHGSPLLFFQGRYTSVAPEEE